MAVLCANLEWKCLTLSTSAGRSAQCKGPKQDDALDTVPKAGPNHLFKETLEKRAVPCAAAANACDYPNTPQGTARHQSKNTACHLSTPIAKVRSAGVAARCLIHDSCCSASAVVVQMQRLGHSRAAIRVAVGGAVGDLAVAVGGLWRQLGVQRQLLGAVVRHLGRCIWVAACVDALS